MTNSRLGRLLKSTALSPFQRRCFRTLTRVPAGKVTTYGDLAAAIKCRSSRAVGQALNCNPFAPTIPCHRVINSTGEIGGYAFGSARKIKLLKSENVFFVKGKIRNFEKLRYRF